MPERITGTQCSLFFTPANNAAASLPGFFDSTDSWSLDFAVTYDEFNEISATVTKRQMVSRKPTFSSSGGLLGGNKEKLMDTIDACFQAKKGTPLWNVRMLGKTTDGGNLDKTLFNASVDDQKLDVTGGNKTGTDAISLVGERVG